MAKHDEFDNFDADFGFDDDSPDLVFEETDEEEDSSLGSDTQYMTGNEGFGSEEDDSLDFEGTAETASNEAEKKEFKKTGIFIVLIGVGLLILIVILLSVVSSVKNRKGSTPVQETQAVVQETANPNEITQIEGVGETAAPTQQAQQQQQEIQATTTVVKDPYDWIEVTLTDSDIQFDAENRLSGIFTVTDIKTYARKTTDGTSNLQLKTVLTGSISGLIGTYTLEIPARISTQVKVGQSLEITYLLKDINGAKVVDDIQ